MASGRFVSNQLSKRESGRHSCGSAPLDCRWARRRVPQRLRSQTSPRTHSCLPRSIGSEIGLATEPRPFSRSLIVHEATKVNVSRPRGRGCHRWATRRVLHKLRPGSCSREGEHSSRRLRTVFDGVASAPAPAAALVDAWNALANVMMQRPCWCHLDGRGLASSAAEASLSDAATYSPLPSALYRVRCRPCDVDAAILKVSQRP